MKLVTLKELCIGAGMDESEAGEWSACHEWIDEVGIETGTVASMDHKEQPMEVALQIDVLLRQHGLELVADELDRDVYSFAVAHIKA